MERDNVYNGPVGSVTGSSLNAPIKESEISRALGKLHAVVEANKKVFTDLDMRLSPILRGEVPTENTDKGLKIGFQSALANEIDHCVGQLEGLYQYILSVKNRVEL